MCGRVILAKDREVLRNELGIDSFVPDPGPNREFKEHWNVPPTSLVPVVRVKDGKRVCEAMRWGLIPAWSKDGSVGTTFNARAESLREKPTFRDAWRKGQRCLIVVSGFYEWRKRDRQAHAVMMADGASLVMAGLWEEWVSPDGEVVGTCTVITTEANAAMAQIHDRIPVILDKADWPKWLGEAAAPEAELYALLKPCPADRIKIWPVDNRVGNVRVSDRGLIEEIKPIGTLL
jgi:putative SOS response-associated peptidase YedK